MLSTCNSIVACNGPFKSTLRCAVVALLAAASSGAVLAQSQPSQTDLQQRSQEQERRAQEQRLEQERLQSRPDIHLPSPATEQVRRLISGESPCFEIHLVQLNGDADASFAWLLEYADGRAELSERDPVQGKCLGALGVQQVIDRLQNALIAHGYTTTRVVMSECCHVRLSATLSPSNFTPSFFKSQLPGAGF